MASINFDADVQDVFEWLQTQDSFIPVGNDQDLRGSTIAYLQSRGVKVRDKVVDRARDVFSKAYAAFAFLKVGNALRSNEFNSLPTCLRTRFNDKFSQAKIQEIYCKIHPDSGAGVLIPPSHTLPLYSEAWKEASCFSNNLPFSFGKISELVVDTAEPVFLYALDLYQCVHDPKLGAMTLKTFQKQYPHLSEKVKDFAVFQEQVLKAGRESFSVCIEALGEEVVKGASLIQYAFENASSQSWDVLRQNLEMRALQISLNSEKPKECFELIRKPLPNEHIFQCAYQLQQLMHDPGLKFKTRKDLAEEYSVLSQEMPDLSALAKTILQKGLSLFPASIYRLGLDPQIIQGALLFEIEGRDGLPNKARLMTAFPQAFDVVQAFFSQFSEAEIQIILKSGEEALTSCPKLLVGSLILIEINDFIKLFKKIGFSILTEKQQKLLNKMKIPNNFSDKMKIALSRYVHRYFGNEKQIDCDMVHGNLVSLSQERNQSGVTRQFEKDGHRLGKVLMVDGNQAILEQDSLAENGILDPLNEEANLAKLESLKKSRADAILQILKNWATSPDGVVDEEQFARLQHLMCQEIEKTATDLAFITEIGPFLAYGIFQTKAAMGWLAERIGGIVPVSWKKTLVKMERMNDGNTFKSSPEYTVSFRLTNNLYDIDLPDHTIRVGQVMENGKVIRSQRIPFQQNGPNLDAIADQAPVFSTEASSSDRSSPVGFPADEAGSD